MYLKKEEAKNLKKASCLLPEKGAKTCLCRKLFAFTLLFVLSKLGGKTLTASMHKDQLIFYSNCPIVFEISQIYFKQNPFFKFLIYVFLIYRKSKRAARNVRTALPMRKTRMNAMLKITGGAGGWPEAAGWPARALPARTESARSSSCTPSFPSPYRYRGYGCWLRSCSRR